MDKNVIAQFNKDLLAKKEVTGCHNQEKFVLMAGYGQKVDGEQVSKLKLESSRTEKGEKQPLNLKSAEIDTQDRCNEIRKPESVNVQDPAAHTIQIRKSTMQEGSEIIKDPNHSEDSRALSGILKTERSSSVQELNRSSKLLVGLASKLLEGKVDDDGEVLMKPSINEVDQALRCLEGARNIQKTKLDFLKFGKDLI